MGSQSKTKKSLASRGSASDQFPGKLHDLLTYTEREDLSDVISWVRNGHAIMVHNSDKLLQLLPMFGLSQTKYRSFERQLNMWHWERIIAGPYKGAWMHPCFVRGSKVLCTYMRRNGPPNQSVALHCILDNKSELAGNSAISDPCGSSGRISPQWNEYMRDFDHDMFRLKDVVVSAEKFAFDEPTPMESSSTSTSKSFLDLLRHEEHQDEDEKWFNGHSFHLRDNCTLPISILEPTPLREDFRSRTIISLLLEPLSDDTIADLF